MCGLILAPEKYAFKVNDALDHMSYRGKEGRSVVECKHKWVLGHNRLAIQDLTDEGKQPFTHQGTMMAFVGEVFNHNGGGEKNALIEAFASPQYDKFHSLDGFWAFAAVQSFGAKVFTDHLGIKPLYHWAEFNIVCSELDPMFCLEQRPALDEVYLSNCIKFGYDYSGRTPYEGISQIAPGTVLEMNIYGISNFKKYWKWDRVKVENGRAFKTEIDKAIMNRLVSDREVALLLSGGLDSSIIYYSLREQGQTQIRCFSVENGESEYLPEGVTPLVVEPVPLREAVEIMQAPLDLGSLIPQIQLARALKDMDINVCLTGDGADELFGGYTRARFYDSQASDIFCELPYYHLPRLDRVMMRSTVELRSPFLSPTIVAMALKIPYEYRTMKQVLKASYGPILPKSIVDRPKLPLKTEAVINGGLTYRQQLVQEFRNAKSSV